MRVMFWQQLKVVPLVKNNQMLKMFKNYYEDPSPSTHTRKQCHTDKLEAQQLLLFTAAVPQ